MMNWGKGIMLFYICFVLGISIMVYRTFFMKQELIQDNYYEAELMYQDELDASKRTLALSEKPELVQVGDSISINWGSDLVNKDFVAEIDLICPNNAGKDMRIKLEHPADQAVKIFYYPQHGYRLIKLNWMIDGKRYLHSFHQTF